MEQTVVEWLEKKIIKFHNWKLNPVYDENCFDEIELDKSIKKAKEMFEQQIIDAGNSCALRQINYNNKIDKMTNDELLAESNRNLKTVGEKYFNETFNK